MNLTGCTDLWVHTNFNINVEKKMKRFLGILSLALLVGVVFFAGDAAAAEGDTFMKILLDKAFSLFGATKKVIFVVGAFGLICLAVAAIFGKMAWKTFVYLALGLAVVAAAGMVINYATGDSVDQSRYGDTFDQAVQDF